MKFKTTAKRVRDGYRCFSVGYCDLQNLLRYQNPVAYTCGIYGWNADVYSFGNIAIVTGYRPFGASIKNGIIREYEDKARKIIDEGMWKDKDLETKVNALLEEFISKAANS